MHVTLLLSQSTSTNVYKTTYGFPKTWFYIEWWMWWIKQIS